MRKRLSNILPIIPAGLLTAALSLNLDASAQTRGVLTGVDVLESEGFACLVGKRVGLITNQTGVNRAWRSTVDVLFEAENVDLVALFSPEHGIWGIAEGEVPSGLDESTGLPIHSLYGETRRPTEGMLKGLHVLVFDIQDIGTRFYTYIGTMKLCMEEAAKHNVEFVVLDRPNPINGTKVEGPVLDPARLFALVGIHSIPIRHGMTIGELALMFNEEDELGLDLKVVKMQGWTRDMWFDQTGLPWVSPSPNMRNLHEAALYPGIGLLERTSVEDKRGLDRPFEQFGAPWIDSIELAAELNGREIAGVRFVPIKFVPRGGRYEGQKCEGIEAYIVDRDVLQPVQCGIEVLQALSKLYPNEFDADKIWHVTRSKELIKQIIRQAPVSEIVKGWQPGLNRFLNRRKRYLLY